MSIESKDTSILIVDDNPANCELLSKRLSRQGYNCFQAFSGKQALELIEQETPDMMLLDMVMPHMDGLEVLRTLRQRHDSISLPVLMVTAKNSGEDVVSAFAAGANDYIEKPVDFPVLLARLQHHLEHKRLDDEVKISRARLQEQNRKLEMGSQYKNNFLSSMSHELRTPLNAVLGFSEVLLDEMLGPLNDKQKQYCREIYNSGAYLLLIINDLLDLSKIEAGKLVLEPQPTDVPDLVNAVIELVKEKAQRAGITLIGEVDEHLHPMGWDPLRVKQMLINLLGNAIKFTESGKQVKLSVARAANGEISLCVADQGCGIAKEDLERIFQPFEQAASPMKKRTAEGTGLGLALVSSLVSLHGGRVEVESQVGVGSRFTLYLPANGHPETR
ncbi:MAG: response regulator [Pseudomonas sp.]|uniref:hybrid sensor histidine kinase/response regulator n=1 Tax=Pseudomonas sp. TaxID=306 RepID=UPI003BB5E399